MPASSGPRISKTYKRPTNNLKSTSARARTPVHFVGSGGYRLRFGYRSQRQKGVPPSTHPTEIATSLLRFTENSNADISVVCLFLELPLVGWVRCTDRTYLQHLCGQRARAIVPSVRRAAQSIDQCPCKSPFSTTMTTCQ